ncbi:MAG: Unknown protein [uncultured Sulfurovum sp.]|uniref:Thiamine pyrimidine synthase n=1 Tax=uncultured Sulfurovum sp. TaxID=269237 RepID=A0A6S6TAH6_9BACT|nr:MAG: Unknown protein [uncultured Sulfurovum sp.]
MIKRLIFTLYAIHLFCTTLWSSPLEKVSLQLKWKYQFQFAGFIMATEKGFYEEVGLDVKLKEFKANLNVINEVLTEESTFGIDDSQLIYYRLQGKPLVGLMTILQTSPVMFLALKESGFTNIKDLDGKRLEITNNSTLNISTQALLRAFHINTLKTSPTFHLDRLINHEVDAMVAYDSNEPYALKKLGYEPQVFSPMDYGFNFYGDILFTTEKTIQEDPQLVKRMHDASKKGWEYAFTHRDETIDIILKKYNTQKHSRESLENEAKVLKKHSNEEHEFSFLDHDKVEAIAKAFAILFPSKYDLST